MSDKNGIFERPLTKKERQDLINELKARIKTYPPHIIQKKGFSNEKLELIDLYMTLGYVESDVEELHDSAIEHFSKALIIAQKLNLKEKISAIEGSIAALCLAKGDYNNAAQIFEETLGLIMEQNIKEKMVTKKGLGISLLKIGGLENEKKGLQYLMDAAEHCVDLNDVNNYMEILTILKEYYEAHKDWQTLIDLEKKALEILKFTENDYEIAMSYIELGIYYSRLKKYRDALDSFKHGVNSAIKSGDNMLIYRGIILVAETYYHLKEIDNAYNEYLQALSLISYIGDEEEIKKTSLVLRAMGADEAEINSYIEKGKQERKRKELEMMQKNSKKKIKNRKYAKKSKTEKK
ncbi:MAG: tetratricopeptide repeat protein [Promethearchaeota archaeon]